MGSSREYMRKYMSRRRKEDPEFNARQRKHTIKYNKTADAANRGLIADFKKDGCALCSEKESCCLSAHHLRDKKFMISWALNKHFSPKAVAEELEKCICVCENCHRKIHAGILEVSSNR